MTPDRDLSATLDEAWAVDDAPEPVGPEPDGEERAWWAYVNDPMWRGRT